MENKTVLPLVMDDGIAVTNMDELMENFSVERVMNYIRSGELPAWLRDKHEDDKADAVEAVNINSSGAVKALRSIFGVEFAEAFEDILGVEEVALKPEEKAEIIKPENNSDAKTADETFRNAGYRATSARDPKSGFEVERAYYLISHTFIETDKELDEKEKSNIKLLGRSFVRRNYSQIDLRRVIDRLQSPEKHDEWEPNFLYEYDEFINIPALFGICSDKITASSPKEYSILKKDKILPDDIKEAGRTVLEEIFDYKSRLDTNSVLPSDLKVGDVITSDFYYYYLFWSLFELRTNESNSAYKLSQLCDFAYKTGVNDGILEIAVIVDKLIRKFSTCESFTYKCKSDEIAARFGVFK